MFVESFACQLTFVKRYHFLSAIAKWDIEKNPSSERLLHVRKTSTLFLGKFKLLIEFGLREWDNFDCHQRMRV
jgi:hypothetical protein